MREDWGGSNAGDNGFIYGRLQNYGCDRRRPFQVGYLERTEVCGGKRKKKPRAAICTIEFNRIVWNTLALLKPLLKTGKGRVSINIKVDLGPGGTGFTCWSEFINLKRWIQTFIIELMCVGSYLFAWISEREWKQDEGRSSVIYRWARVQMSDSRGERFQQVWAALDFKRLDPTFPIMQLSRGEVSEG